MPAIAAENVPVPAFRNVELNGGGEVTLVPGATQRVTILSGSSAFTRMRVDDRGKLRIDETEEESPAEHDNRDQQEQQKRDEQLLLDHACPSGERVDLLYIIK